MRWNLASPLLSDETLRSNASCVFPLLAGPVRRTPWLGRMKMVLNKLDRVVTNRSDLCCRVLFEPYAIYLNTKRNCNEKATTIYGSNNAFYTSQLLIDSMEGSPVHKVLKVNQGPAKRLSSFQRNSTERNAKNEVNATGISWYFLDKEKRN